MHDNPRGRSRAQRTAWRNAIVLVVAAWMGTACAGRAPEGGRPRAGAAPSYDLLIRNGTIIDGSGSPRYVGDVAVRAGRIVAIGPTGTVEPREAAQLVDATGLVVAPGFIDVLSGSGGALLYGDGRSVSKVTQGITTEILGEGSSAAPVRDDHPGLRGTPGQPPRVFAGEHAFDDWLNAMERHGISPNVGSFVGGSTLRRYGMGLSMKPATPGALDSMRTAMRNAMEDGALGLGTALIYAPGNYASTEELIEIAKVMRPYGGLYITHMRSEADRVLEGIDEAIRIGKEAGVPVEIYHLKVAGKRNWPKAAQVVAKIDSARAAGIDITANMYPYTAAATGLTACLPTWISADGKLFENLSDPATRARVRAEVENPTSYWENFCEQATPEGVVLTRLRHPDNVKWTGRSLSDVMAETGKDWLDAVMDLIVSERQRVEAIFFLMSEENIRLFLEQPWMSFCTDAGGRDPERSANTVAHPRAYGTFTKILGQYVREEKLLTLEEAIRKMTSLPAERLAIRDRGLLKPGNFADIVVFDPETVADRATYEQPHQLSVGMKHVFVNGVEVVRDGVHTGAKPGRAVRGSGWRRPVAAAGTASASGAGVPAAAGPGEQIASASGRAVATGAAHSCALGPGGRAFCWGDGQYGQLGNGSRSSSTVPVEVAGGHEFVSITTGANHSCGIERGGAAYCWGDGQWGQLGNGTRGAGTVADRPTPVVGGHTFVMLSAGDNHTCGVTTEGRAYCWGFGQYGRLGDGGEAHRATPSAVAGGLRFALVSAGHYHTCGVTTDGQAYCWGFSANGRLGNGTDSSGSVVKPARIHGLKDVVSIAAGEAHSCAVTSSGAAYCWGSGRSHQLGNGKVVNRTLPRAVAGGQKFVAISAGLRHSCAVTVDGAGYCWGQGASGKLGASVDSSPTPMQVKSPTDDGFAFISAGKEHTCGVTTGGAVACWGEGDGGRLGTGSTRDEHRPKLVRLGTQLSRAEADEVPAM